MKITRIPYKGKDADPAAVSGADYTSPAREIMHMEGYSYQIVVPNNGGAGGTLTLEVSNHAKDSNVNDGDLPSGQQIWSTVAGSSQVVPAGGGTFFYNVTDVYYEAVRFRYATADTGTITEYFLGKGIM